MLDKLSTLLIVTVITALIWLYAEGQKLDTIAQVTPVFIEAPAESDLIVKAGSLPRDVSIELKGPTGALGNVEEILSRGIHLIVGRDGVPSSAGTHTVSLLEALRRHEAFAEAGVSIRDVEPDTITYTIDRFVNTSFDVQAGRISGVELEGPITVDPPRVEIRIAEGLLREWPPEQRRLIATPDDAERIRTLPPGVPHTVEARLVPPDITDEDSVLLPPTPVRLAFTIRSQRMEITKTAVPIHVGMPPLDLNRYEIELIEPVIPSLRLSGPRELIARVERGELRIIGYLYFSSDELLRNITEKEVSFQHLPDALRLESEPVIATFTITRRPDVAEE